MICLRQLKKIGILQNISPKTCFKTSMKFGRWNPESFCVKFLLNARKSYYK